MSRTRRSRLVAGCLALLVLAGVGAAAAQAATG